jgi:hypothetical protein
MAHQKHQMHYKNRHLQDQSTQNSIYGHDITSLLLFSSLLGTEISRSREIEIQLNIHLKSMKEAGV